MKWISPSNTQDDKRVIDEFEVADFNLCLFDNIGSIKRKESEEAYLFPSEDARHANSEKRPKKEDLNTTDSCDYLFSNENKRRKEVENIKRKDKQITPFRAATYSHYKNDYTINSCCYFSKYSRQGRKRISQSEIEEIGIEGNPNKVD